MFILIVLGLIWNTFVALKVTKVKQSKKQQTSKLSLIFFLQWRIGDANNTNNINWNNNITIWELILWDQCENCDQWWGTIAVLQHWALHQHIGHNNMTWQTTSWKILKLQKFIPIATLISLWQHKSDRFQIEFSIEVKFESLSGGYKVIQICWEILSQYTWTFEQFKWNDCKKCNQNDLSMAHRISVRPKFKPFT